MVLRETDVVYGATAKQGLEVSKGTGSAAAKSSPTPQPSTIPQQQQMAFQSAVEAGETNGTAPAGTSPGQDPAAIKLSARERRRLAKLGTLMMPMKCNNTGNLALGDQSASFAEQRIPKAPH